MGDGLFGDLPAIEVPLAKAPLTRVLAQIRFPSVPELMLPDGQYRFSQSLRSLYPIGRQQAGINLVIGPQGVTQQPSQNMLWQLQSKDADWQVSFSDGFVALETSAYVSRADFCSRLEVVLAALCEVSEPVMCDRIGVRYINQISDVDILQDLDKYLNPHALGSWGLSRGSERAHLVQSVSESLFTYDADRMLLRSGLIPGGGSAEPTVPVLNVNSWLLDLDSFADIAEEFSAAYVVERVRSLADAAYRGFKALVSEEFLSYYS
ncbi:TIGR04255 family protein [Streptomyces sp. NPDC004646]